MKRFTMRQDTHYKGGTPRDAYAKVVSYIVEHNI